MIPSTTNSDYILNKLTSAVVDGWFLYHAVSTPQVYYRDAVGTVAQANGPVFSPTTGAWHHVCSTLNDGVLATTYTNGVAGTAVVPTGTLTAGTGDFLVGRYSATYYDGAIDSVLIFDYDIGQEGVTLLYKDGEGRYY
jgi:hypothetical protein